jgi:hypothetical protein
MGHRNQGFGLFALVLLLASVALFHEGNAMTQEPAEKTAPRPFTVEGYYRARWGHADEFLALYTKNHLPVLRELQKQGKILAITAVKPRYHATEESRWDYRVTLVFRDVAAAFDPDAEEAIKVRLFPDQATYRREEHRRFEILDAHWDVPITDVDLDRPVPLDPPTAK